MGQPDLYQQRINTVTATSLNGPLGLALDTRGGKTELYIADSGNSRVRAWHTHSYGIGDPAALILAQPGPAYSNPRGIGAQGFGFSPISGLGIAALAADPTTGDLYVAERPTTAYCAFAIPLLTPRCSRMLSMGNLPSIPLLQTPRESTPLRYTSLSRWLAMRPVIYGLPTRAITASCASQRIA